MPWYPIWIARDEHEPSYIRFGCPTYLSRLYLIWMPCAFEVEALILDFALFVMFAASDLDVPFNVNALVSR